MYPSPSVLMALIVLLSVAVAVEALVLGLAWTRLRALALARPSQRLEALERRQGELEQLLLRVGASAEPPTLRHPIPPPKFSGSARRGGPPAGESTLIAIPTLAGPAAEATAAAAEELGRRFGAIWELAEAGASAGAIARQTGQPIGQVELILALRRPLPTSPGGRA